MIALPMLADPPPAQVATTPEVDALLARHEPVAVGVSGGKDSTAVALATFEHLDRVGHRGPRVLVHADLGAVEWADSLPACERLAAHLGAELIVVRRSQGGMMERWEQRWRDNVKRWESLSCVKLILPWSTPAMRFCTAELKVDQITRELSRRFPGRCVINVTGVRRSESTERQNAPVYAPNPKLARKSNGATGVDWNGIALWSESDVWAAHERHGVARHEGYRRFGARRISCVACMLATAADHQVAARDERNHPALIRQVRLEISSTFAFQGNRWLGDTLADLLPPDLIAAIAEAKDRGAKREAAEARIPKHLLYEKGWPKVVPTPEEALLLGAVRFAVADALGLEKTFIAPSDIIRRYEQLLAEKALRNEAVVRRQSRRAA